MYTAKHFKNENTDEVMEFIHQNGFAVLASQENGRLCASHIPLLLSQDRKKLLGHVAKANPQWKNFSTGEEVLAIFNGPHAYISSSWYDHENVPTWNYIAVHVYGSIRVIEGDELYESLKSLVSKYEKQSENPVSVEKMSSDYVKNSMKGLVGFEIAISSIEASYKLSQNRDVTNYNNIISQLEKRGDAHSSAVAVEMKKVSPFLHKT